MKLPAFEYACPATINEAVALLAVPRRRGQGAGRRPVAGADDGVPRRPAVAAGRFAEAPGPERDQDRRRTASASARWCAGATSSTTSGSPPRIRCCARRCRTSPITRSGNRGTVGGSCAHADPASEMPGIAVTLRGDVRGGRQGRRPHHQGRRFLPGRADHGAEARRDHHRDPSAGVARRPPLGLSRIRPPPRRFRHVRRRALLRCAGRQGGRTPMSA